MGSITVDTIPGGYNFFYIEGIGSSKGLIGSLVPFESNSQLVCYMENDTTCYPYFQAPCTLINSSNSIKKEEGTINIFPNPVENELFIDATSLHGHSIKKIQVIDLSGRIVIIVNDREHFYRIDTKALSAGFFVLQIENEMGNVLTQKLIKTD